MGKQWTLRFDGGASPNPGNASCAFSATADDGAFIEKCWQMRGTHTNNEAEWEAAVVGLEAIYAIDSEPATIHIIGDSELVINQMRGVYRVKKPQLLVYYERFVRLKAKGDTHYSYASIPREQNAQMDTLCKEARR